ncbi:MAG: protein TolQ, partial [Dokdonella sp.]
MNHELNVFALIWGASLPVKFVLVLLIVFSVASWMIIFRKKAMIDRANASANDFEERFWSGSDLAALFKDVNASGERIG